MKFELLHFFSSTIGKISEPEGQAPKYNADTIIIYEINRKASMVGLGAKPHQVLRE